MGTVHYLLPPVGNVREPTREEDERLLRVMRAFEDSGVRVVDADEALDMQALHDGAAEIAKKFAPLNDQSAHRATSSYLNQPLRTEEEVRAKRGPRIPRAKGLLELIAEQTGIDRAFAKLIGRDHD